MSKGYKIYKDFSTYKEVLNTYNELIDQVKDITTIEQAKQWQEDNKIQVEINGDLIQRFIEIGGTNDDIEWIRYNEYKMLSYVYCHIKNRKVSSVAFDVYAEACDCEFIDSVYVLSQEKYYEEMENIITKVFYNDDFVCIGFDTEELPNIKYN